MGFIRENILKILTIIIIFIVLIIVFTFVFGRNGSKGLKSYSTYENNLKTAAIEYANNNTKLLPRNENEVSKINLDTLVNEKAIDQLYALEDENIKCSGYVEIAKKDKDYSYTPYIKCGNYYITKTIAEYLKTSSEVVTKDDGLYQMGNKYVFRGENPNNYLYLGEKLYRIIEITEDDELKLVSVQKYSSEIKWDDRYNIEKDRKEGINDYSKSRLKDNLQKIYKSEFFSEEERSKIVEHSICIGKRSIHDASIDGTAECSVQYPNQKISIIQLNEYMRASTDPNCVGASSKACSNYNYFSNISSSFRTITAVSDNTYQIYYIYDGKASVTNASNTFSVYPVVYIDNALLYNNGNGTYESPYTIK